MTTASVSTPLMEAKFGPDFKDKTRTNDGLSALPQFLLQSFVLFPLWLFLVVPIMLLYLLVKGLLGLVGLCRPPSAKDPFNGIPTDPADDRKEASVRKFDFILMGATGFTGKLAAEYIATVYGMKKYKWAIAGRSISKLEAVKKALVAINEEMKSLELVVGNSLDHKEMCAIAAQSRLVMSTVGPFARYGTPLVSACARYGTHYCDITGEVDWVRHVVHKLDKCARSTGARIVSLCGQDSVPWDLAAYIAHDILSKRGEGAKLESIKIFDEFKGSASGGTISTLFTSFQHPLKKIKGRFDPMATDAKGGKSVYKTKMNFPKWCCSFNSEYGEFVAPFVMAPVNSNVVRRSNSLLGYSPGLEYYEVEAHAGCMSAWLSVLQTFWFATAIYFPPWKAAMMTFLPSPGEGPSRTQMKEGYLKLTALATSTRKDQIIVRLGFTTDPAYEDTARMLVESGLCSLDETVQKRGESGVVSPACAFGGKLLERLQHQGRGIFYSVSSL